MEPEALNYAEKRRITQTQKTYLTHSQLGRILDQKNASPKEKIEFKSI